MTQKIIAIKVILFEIERPQTLREQNLLRKFTNNPTSLPYLLDLYDSD